MTDKQKECIHELIDEAIKDLLIGKGASQEHVLATHLHKASEKIRKIKVLTE